MNAKLNVTCIDGVVVASNAMRELFAFIDRIAPTNAAVLITGETGSGKEAIARTIHARSLRCGKRWIDINCAALPEHLVETELFGHEKGAFSGADSTKPGLFELADGGTLFLDEIGELDPRVQVKLLRVLDGVPYFRVGGTRKVETDVRVVAATNQDIEKAIAERRFRSDLYHRLGQFHIKVPALRHRPEEIPILLQHFLDLQQCKTPVSNALLAALDNYAWPGNVRELRNVAVQLAAVRDADLLDVEHLPPGIGGGGIRIEQPTATTNLESLERNAIMAALSRSGGKHEQASRELGISRRTLIRKLKQYKNFEEPLAAKPSRGVQRDCRVAVSLPSTIVFPSGTAMKATISNISAGGAGLEGATRTWPAATDFDVCFTLPGSATAMEVKARLIWSNERGQAGVQFVELDSVDNAVLTRWVDQQLLRPSSGLPTTANNVSA